MKVSELKEQTADQLRDQERALEESLFRMRIQKAMGQLDAPIKLRTTRRDLARVKTVLRQREAR